MTDEEHRDCCPDCKQNERSLEALRELALSNVGQVQSRNLSRPRTRTKQLYKESAALSETCDGKAGDVIEVRMRSVVACKPMKMIIEESVPDATRFVLLLKSDGESVFPSSIVDVPSKEFSAAAQVLGCGIALPNLYVDEEYVFSFRFAKTAKVVIRLYCVAFRDPAATLPRK